MAAAPSARRYPATCGVSSASTGCRRRPAPAVAAAAQRRDPRGGVGPGLVADRGHSRAGRGRAGGRSPAGRPRRCRRRRGRPGRPRSSRRAARAACPSFDRSSSSTSSPTRAEDQAVDQVVAQTRGHLALTLPEAVGLVDQHRPAVLGGRLHDGAGQLGEVRHVEGGHGQGDHAGPSLAQAAGGQVRPVVQVVDRRLHPLAGVRLHVQVAVRDVGHRLDRHPGSRRDVAQPDHHALTLDSVFTTM